MRKIEPFQADDLAELDERILSRASRVVSMREIATGAGDSVIGMRHDVDNRFDPCVELAQWEADRGYRATYFILHHAPYWDDDELQPGLERIASLGHEIGLHVNALTVALLTGRDPAEIVHEALSRIRGWGHLVTGVVGHGDKLCGHVGFVNDEMFSECQRPEMGAHDRELEFERVRVSIQPRSLAEFGLSYESYRAGGRRLAISDSGGRWNQPFDVLCAKYSVLEGQAHALIHPCWWVDAFAKVPA